MNKADRLSEFDVLQKRSKSFYFVLSTLLLVTCFSIVPAFFYLKNLASGYSEISATPIILLSVVTVYPIIGCYGFYHMKKYGWIICSHYTLSTTVVALGIIFFEQTFYKLSIQDIMKITCELLIGMSSIYSCINLFTKKYLELFFIDRSYIFLAFMLTILFPLFWFGILLTFDK